jgi:hypothetical protein
MIREELIDNNSDRQTSGAPIAVYRSSTSLRRDQNENES